MHEYKNKATGATITTACEITGGGWEPVNPTPKQTEEEKKPKTTTAKRKKNE